MDRRRFINLCGKLIAAMRVLPLATLLPTPKPPLSLRYLFETCYDIKRRRQQYDSCGPLGVASIQHLSPEQVNALFPATAPGFETTDGSDPIKPLLTHRPRRRSLYDLIMTR